MEFAGLAPGYIKPAPVAWFASHRHHVDGSNEPYNYCYLFGYVIETQGSAKTITLPRNEALRLLAITVSEEEEKLVPAQPFYEQIN